MKNPRPLGLVVDRIVPDFWKHMSPRTVQFVEKWLDWLSLENKPYWNLSNLEDMTSVDESFGEFYEMLKHEFAADFPEKVMTESRVFVKNLIQLYRSKGVEEAYRLIFRVFWNCDVKISYPGLRVLRSSDNQWVEERFIATPDISSSEFWKYLNCLVRGNESGAEASVKDVAYITLMEGDEFPTPVLVVEGETAVFIPGETVTVKAGTAELIGTTFTVGKYDDRPGYWETTDSFLSADKRFQDNWYYQDFSYVVSAPLHVNEWYRIVVKLLHPAGMKIFSRYIMNSGDGEPVPIPDPFEAFTLWILKMNDFFAHCTGIDIKYFRKWKYFFDLATRVDKVNCLKAMQWFAYGQAFDVEWVRTLKTVRRFCSGQNMDPTVWQLTRPPAESTLKKHQFMMDVTADWADVYVVGDFASSRPMDTDILRDSSNEITFKDGMLTRGLHQ